MNERKVIGPECSASFRKLDNTVVQVTRDVVSCPRCRNIIYPSAGKGSADVKVAFCLGIGLRWVAVEVKWAGKSSYPFDKLRKEQEDWLRDHTGSGLNKDGYLTYVWIGIGERIGGKKYPRKTWLIPFADYEEIKEYLKEHRKSISFNDKIMEQYELVWKGKKIWEIPDEHIFWTKLLAEEM